MKNILTNLNIAIDYSDIEGRIAGSIILDADDWAAIITGLANAGYTIVREDDMSENKQDNQIHDIVLDVQDGYIDASVLFNHIDEGLNLKEENEDGKVS